MTSPQRAVDLLRELCRLPRETEWVEFKCNQEDVEEIGTYVSALANSVALDNRPYGYLVWGVEDGTHAIVGTKFNPSMKKVGNEELENWLCHSLVPQVYLKFMEFEAEGFPCVILRIGQAEHRPVQFKGTEFIRVGSYRKKLKDHPEKERALWSTFKKIPFEKCVALGDLKESDVLSHLDYPAYFHLLKASLPESRSGILDALTADGLIRREEGGRWSILNIGAILYALRLDTFHTLKRKAIRVVFYKGDGRVHTIREHTGNKGYAVGFEPLINFLTDHLPQNEVLEAALRQDIPMYPELALRELAANALIHQDFSIGGTGPMIEIFDGRIEFTNPGLPLVNVDRFLGSPPRSRNEAIASLLRRIGVCEERGSGVEKVVFETEFHQLPAPIFETTPQHTRAVLFSHRDFNEMTKEDRIRACYLHACLCYVQRKEMTNSSLRERFGIATKNSASVSRIIKDAVHAGLVYCKDETVGTRARTYLPRWAK